MEDIVSFYHLYARRSFYYDEANDRQQTLQTLLWQKDGSKNIIE